MFFKTRMRRLLRGMIEAAAPPGLRPDHGATVARALVLERAAIAFGLIWQGLSPAQAALVVIHGARALAGLGSAEADRLAGAAARFAAQHGLEAFSVAIAQDVLHIERLRALRRQGHAARAPSGDGRLPMLA
ncbi:hypothetical protein [Neoroseomonas lacus]|uniref:Uncharacterized protein n=1 Tax=Neoroseomonas lacus TaxID=287609 RepID=A0A917KTJ4_9PROT|nr:hypothetical protein [Neoroseomonas lacus]GGJ29322.1 hypothetical protein GCM10011320_40760 [Neoroseomonas lacus]